MLTIERCVFIIKSTGSSHQPGVADGHVQLLSEYPSGRRKKKPTKHVLVKAEANLQHGWAKCCIEGVQSDS